MFTLALLLACSPEGRQVLVDCAADGYQLDPGFHNCLTEAHACTSSMLGGVDDAGGFLDRGGNIRMQIYSLRDEPTSIVVFTGENLDSVWSDGNACDDMASGIGGHVTHMAWSMVAGSVLATNNAEGRTFELVDVLLEPDAAYNFSEDFEDVADYDAVEVGSVVIGPVIHGGQLNPL